jgi:hypothetical protein
VDPQATETAIKAFLQRVCDCLEHAAGLARAAKACAESGNVGKAVEIALDVEQPLYKANTLVNAASLINRIGQT